MMLYPGAGYPGEYFPLLVQIRGEIPPDHICLVAAEPWSVQVSAEPWAVQVLGDPWVVKVDV